MTPQSNATETSCRFTRWKTSTPELPPEGEYWVAPNAVLIGRVRLLKGASVWWGCVLRGDNDWITVGENSNVQDNSVIHTDPGQPVTIGSNCTVGHRVILHSTTIGDGSLIGMGSTLLNRSRIGEQLSRRRQHAGHRRQGISGRLDDPGLAGARRARSSATTELTMLKMSSAGYVHNHQRFRDKLRQVG